MNKTVKNLALIALIMTTIISLALPAYADSEDVEQYSYLNIEDVENASTVDEQDVVPIAAIPTADSQEEVAISAVPITDVQDEVAISAIPISDSQDEVAISAVQTEISEIQTATDTTEAEEEDIERTAALSSTPLAELYFYNHTTTSGSGWTLPTLDTTACMTITKNCISNAGYNSYAYVDVAAGPTNQPSVLRTLQNDAFVTVFAHGSNGAMFCVDGSNAVSLITANATNLSAGYSLQYNFSNTTDKLKYTKIAYWMGCNTYGTSSTYGSLPSMCTSLGIDCVITNNSTVYTPYACRFLYYFGYYGDSGYSVGTSLSKARTQTMTYYGYSTPYDTTTYIYMSTSYYRVDGANSNPASVYLEPAGYGVY